MEKEFLAKMIKDKKPSLEDIASKDNLTFLEKSKRFFNSYGFRFYSSIAPSLIFPLAIGMSDSLGFHCPEKIRYPIYTFGVLMHLGKYQCPPAFSSPGENLMGGMIFTIGSYWLGRGIGALANLAV